MLRIAPDPAFPPLEFFDKQGSYRGMVADYMMLIGQRLGISFDVIRKKNWVEAVEALRNGEADLLGGYVPDEKSSKDFLFTKPYFGFHNVIVTHSGIQGRKRLEELAGKKVLVVRGWPEADILKTRYPLVEAVEVENSREGLSKVAFREYDYYFGYLLTASYIIREHGLAGLRVVGLADNPIYDAIAVSGDSVMLRDILQKALDSITPEERRAIEERWISVLDAHAKSEKIDLTIEERDWLDSHSEITLGFTAEIEPLLIVDEDGQVSGILPDIYNEVESVTGIKVNIMIGEWSSTIQKAKDGKIDGLLVSASSLAEDAGLIHTHILTTGNPTIFAKKDAPFEINSGEDLKGKKISVLKGVYVVEQL